MVDTEKKIRILLVDDHPVVRDGLAAMLETQQDFDVVGGAADGEAAVAEACRLLPDVTLLDLEMPRMDGVEAIQQIQVKCPSVRIIAFTAFDTDERIMGAIQAGAQGYLLKGAPRQELFNAIRIVHAGGSLLQPIVASRLMQQLSQEKVAEPVEKLTPRELEVLHLLARGMQNKMIAAELVISERTVKFHISSIMGKLGASNRTEVVSIAAQYGMIEL